MSTTPPPQPEKPEGDDPQAWADYLDAVDDWVSTYILPAQEKAIRREAIMGIIKLSKFLDDQP